MCPGSQILAGFPPGWAGAALLLTNGEVGVILTSLCQLGGIKLCW